VTMPDVAIVTEMREVGLPDELAIKLVKAA
jgi:hypothetical protein